MKKFNEYSSFEDKIYDKVELYKEKWQIKRKKKK